MDPQLRDKARVLVRSGALPCKQQERTWAGRGLGFECSLCGQLIRRDQVEYELQFASDGEQKPRLHRFHVACVPIWELARREDC